MLRVEGLSVHFGERSLFNDVSYLINKQDRIGLVGRNGAGKSTMLKILAKIQSPDEGRVHTPKEFRIGYLPQEMEHNMHALVRDEAASAFDEVQSIQKEIDKVTKEMETRTDYESESYNGLIEKLTDLNDRMSMIGGYQVHEQIEKILFGLGFEPEDLDRKMEEFSGGWRMRVELAKVLLKRPDLLLLDEPTNHLDIESIQWLENFLKTYHGSILLISHDRTFLDVVTNRTIEISLGKIYDYKFSYSKYVVQREEERQQQFDAAKNQQKYIDQTERLINRFRAKNTKASFAQSLMKKLDKLDRIEVEQDDSTRMKVTFPPAPRSGKVVVEAKNVSKSYGDLQVLKDVSFIIGRGERVSFVGKNGVGKTTLSKIIVDVEKASGDMELGHNVEVGYYAQNQAELLDEKKTVLETLEYELTPEMNVNIRNLLGAFLFSGDDVDKKVKVLSGGEKARLAFCRLLLKPYNLLVLDEPTNHLDMRSKEVLKEALMKYDGSLILVSHDRDFLDGLTNRIYEFRKGNIRFLHGGIKEFLASRKVDNMADLAKNPKAKPAAPAKKEKSAKLDYKARKQLEKDIRKLSNKVSRCEKEISALEEELAELGDKLALITDPTSEEAKAGYKKYEELQFELDQWMADWEAAETELTRLEKENA